MHATWSGFRDNNVGGEIYCRYLDLQESDLIDHFYLSVVNRGPDGSGKAAWQSEMPRVQSLGLDVREVFLLMSSYFFDSAEYQFRNRDNTQYVTDRVATFFNRHAGRRRPVIFGCNSSMQERLATWCAMELSPALRAVVVDQCAEQRSICARPSAHDVPELARVSVTHKPRCAGRLLTLRSNRIAHRERFAAKKIVARGQ